MRQVKQGKKEEISEWRKKERNEWGKEESKTREERRNY